MRTIATSIGAAGIRRHLAIPIGLLVLLGLYLASRHSYLLFHSLAELFAIVVGCGIFVLAWNSRRLLDSSYLMFIGIAYLFIAAIDVVHTLSYTGMGIFEGYGTNLPTQLWIAARYVESATLLAAPLLIRRKLDFNLIFLGFAVITSLLLASIFYWSVFPQCFIEGEGLTLFKKVSEYVISIMLLSAVVLLYRKRAEFDKGVLQLLVASIVITIGSELAFTLYTDAYGFANMIGHLLKIISFYLIYKAIIETGLTKPYDLLFRNLKQSEEALRAGEKKYRQLVESLNEGIWGIDKDGRTTFVNPRMAEMLGYEVEEMQGEPLSQFMDESNVKSARQMIERRLQGLREQHDFEFVRKDGTRFYAIVETSPMSDDEGNYIGALAGVQNITERKEAEEALERSESKYRALVESSPDGVLSVGDDGHILDCNESICQLLGYTKEEIIGTSFRDLLSKAAAEDLLSYRAQLAHSRQVEQEFEMTHRSGKAVAVWAKMVPLQEGGDGISRVVVYLRDTEERKKLSQLKDEFIGLVSHELRSPLTVIIGAINTALTEETRLSAEESHHLLQDAAIEAESLSHLVGNLLELSRVQADQLTLYTEPSNLDAAVQSVVDKLKRTYPSHTFVVDISHETPPITADQLRLERILFNLMDNAAKYSSEGTEISVFARQDSEHLIVGVSDQGIGITPHDQAKLFAPFQRLEDYRSDGARGAGLGLLVCRRLVEAHGGRIWVESEPGRGSTFFFALPLGQRPGR